MTLFERTWLVESEAGLDDFLGSLMSMDLQAKSTLLRSNTEWRLHALTILMFLAS